MREVILNEADGMDWPTLCKCDVMQGVGEYGSDHKPNALDHAEGVAAVFEYV
jgi:hypothetical protein